MAVDDLDTSLAAPIMITVGSLGQKARAPKVVQFAKQRVHMKTRVQKFLKSRISCLSWIGDYNIEFGVNDLIAGTTLGLTIIPESIACALLAGLPARYGLCSAFIGSFVYLIFGSIHKVIIGPTSLVALVSVQYTVEKPIEFAFLLTLLSGVVQIIMSVLRMGFVFEFISVPVIKAFSSATAVLVIESQIKVLLGIKYLVPGMLESIQMLSLRIQEANMGDLVIGLMAIGFLIALDQIEKVSHHPKFGKVLRVFCQYLSFSRNTLVVLIAGLVAYFWLDESGNVPFTLSRNALSGLPNFTFPSLNVSTPERYYSFWDVLAELNIGIIVIPIVGILTNISIGKLTPKGLVDCDQELMTVGVCNVFGSFVQSMPTSGAFSRFAISTACGLKTPMANLYSGIIVLLALSYVSPYFNFIPEAVLAAILICSIYTLLDFKLPRRLWRESKRDFGIWILCFFGSILFGVEVGLFVSIIVNVLHLLFLWARPQITVNIEEIADIQYILVRVSNGIYFPAINYLREKVLKSCDRYDFCLPVVIDCINVNGLDYTAGQGISRLAVDLLQNNAKKRPIMILYRMQKEQKKLIDIGNNIFFTEDIEQLHECLCKESLCNAENITLNVFKDGKCNENLDKLEVF